MRIWAGIAFVIQTLKALEERIVAKECVSEIALDEISLRRSRREIVNENRAGFSGAEKIDSQFERAEIFWAVDQDRVALLQALRQNLTGIAVEKIDIRFRLQLRFRRGNIFRLPIVLNANDPRLRKATRENERAFPASTA